MDVINGTNVDGTLLQVWDCGIPAAANQQFEYTAYGDNQYVQSANVSTAHLMHLLSVLHGHILANAWTL